MNYNRIITVMTILVMAIGQVMAQDDAGVVYHEAETKATEPSVKELKVGDTLPDYTFAHPLVNYPGERVRTSDFRGKLLILEFWSMGCVSCIAGFPKLQKLQEEFDDQIQILLVNPWSDRKAVLDLLERRRKLTGFEMKLPIAFGDTTLSDHFPRLGVPHVVWVNADGVIALITDGTQLTAENIQEVLKGGDNGITQAVTHLTERDYEKPLFVAGNGGDGSDILWHSVLAKADFRLQSTVSVRPNKIILQNSPLAFIYRVAYGYPEHPFNYGLAVRLQPNRIVFELPPAQLKLADSVFVYELSAPEKRSQGELLKVLQQDLKQYFGWQARWEKRRVECLVLTASDTALLVREKQRENPPVWQNLNELTVNIENASVPEFVFWLENFPLLHGEMPIIDETGYQGRITGIRLEGINRKDWKDWNRHLEPYGLQFVVRYREVDMLVVSE